MYRSADNSMRVVEYIQTDIAPRAKNPKPPFNSLKIVFLSGVFKNVIMWKSSANLGTRNNASIRDAYLHVF